MTGHVNMMDDVLIANLPPDSLRAVLRTLVSNPESQQIFTAHVRSKIATAEAPPVTEQDACLRHARCLFSSKLSREAVTLLTSFVSGNSTIASPEIVNGDIVQAMQALKESTAPDETLKTLLSTLSDALATHPQSTELARAHRQVQDTTSFFFPDTAHASSSQTLQISLPANSGIETTQLGSFHVPRLFVGLWQLASPAWGTSSLTEQQSALAQLVSNGFTAADMSDHYGDAELIYGDFRASTPASVQSQIYAASKWCIFKTPSFAITREYVLDAVKERCRRLSGTVQLLQFHWHDYSSPKYLEVIEHLVDITQTNPELVAAVGLCNFDAERTEKICEYLLAKHGKVGIVSNQVQFSVIDSRPLKKMVQVCEKYNLKLLTYGSFCGGFLSEKWLRAAPDPYADSLTPSQRKYLDSLSTWGTWSDFQLLLSTLAEVAATNNVSLANVATRWVLQQPAVGAVIVGTRLGVSEHVNDNLRVFEWTLSDSDVERINKVALGVDGERMESVFAKLGDCGGEYRR